VLSPNNQELEILVPKKDPFSQKHFCAERNFPQTMPLASACNLIPAAI